MRQGRAAPGFEGAGSMREIKFRGKSKEKNSFVYGNFVFMKVNKTHGNFCIIPQDGENKTTDDIENSIEDVFPETIGQYTGLKDRNGTRIFEGDIIRYPDNKNMEVRYRYGGFIVFQDAGKPIPLFVIAPEKIEVIGNIHDNPKLLTNNKGGV